MRKIRNIFQIKVSKGARHVEGPVYSVMADKTSGSLNSLLFLLNRRLEVSREVDRRLIWPGGKDCS